MSEQRKCTLRVGESRAQDVGRGIARVDPEVLERLELQVGDIVTITGGRTTVGKAMPTFQEMRGEGLIQIDGIIRQNAWVGLDERVSLGTANPKPARKIVLQPLSTPVTHSKEHGYLGRIMEGLPLVAGDKVRAILFGTSTQEFQVEQTFPEGPCLVDLHTEIELAREQAAEVGRRHISYEDIGGLQHEIQRVREMIELPLKYPEVFHRMGIDPPKGVLLLGPPGTGKTLIARAVANETVAHFQAINGPEVIHKFYGESEAKLRTIFQEAKKRAPSIIFLDEIDAIAPKREKVVGDVEKRVVAQLLALMDGLTTRGQVMVLGATNIPNALDPALRRPGRFDREIPIGIPDRDGRKEILEIHTRGMPLDEDIDLSQLAQITHGYVGADLEALCREAAMRCLRRLFPKIEFSEGYIPEDAMDALRVTQEDFQATLNEIEPSAIREVIVEVPNVQWEDVGGLESVKRRLIEYIEYPLRFPDLFTKAATTPPKGILLHGPPGTGKTLLAKAAATESEANFISVKGPELLSKWVGEAEQGIRELFKKARQSAPCIVFLDEVEALAPVRSAGQSDAGVMGRVLSQLLTEIDGIEELQGVLILAATNRLDLVDPALMRSGRLEVHFELPVPDAQARRDILNIHLRKKPVHPDVSIDWLVEETAGGVGADLEALVRGAALCAIEEYVEMEEPDLNEFRIRESHFLEAFQERRFDPKERGE